MAYSKARRLSDSISATGEVSAFVDGSITHADLHTDMDLTGKTVLVANTSTGDSDTTVANTAFVQQEIAALVASAPGTLNTLNELAAALGDDASFSTTVTDSIATKLPLAGGTLTGALAMNTNAITSTGDLTLDIAGNIVLDADGGGVYFKDAGTNIGFLQNSGANDFRIVAGQQDKDIFLMGDDGGSIITALTLDMSEAGAATFNSTVISPLIDATIVDGENFKIAGAQGSDGQVLTSTGSGVAWEAVASSFASLTDTTVTNADPTLTTNPSSGVGTIWVNSTSAETYVCTDATTNANVWTNIGDGTGAIAFSSTGGTKVTTGGYVYHTFTSSGNFVFSGSKSAQALIIAGGGGGGGQAANGGGGGGAGGLVYASSINLTSQTYAVTVGAGGVAGGTSGGNGGNSSFQGQTVAVGGGGGGANASTGNSGGSGGGGGRDSGNTSGGAATSGQGNAGGVSINSCGSAGGGGGAGQAGIAGAYDCNNMNATQSDGGDGVNTYSAWATATSTGVGGYYAGGGAGAVEAQAHLYGRNEGGLGGGGIGSMSYDQHGTAGTANTGSGGGGGQTFQSVQRNAGAGGSGLVIIRYAV